MSAQQFPVWSRSQFSANNISISYCTTIVPQSGPSSITETTFVSALPVLIFLHGLSKSAATLIPYISFFNSSFDIVLPDARGHGETQPIPPGTFTQEWLLEDAAEVIRYFSPDRPAYLMGHSMGAATAARVAQRYPELVRAVILEEPPWSHARGQPLKSNNTLIPEAFLVTLREIKSQPVDIYEQEMEDRAKAFSPLAESEMGAMRKVDVDDVASTFASTDVETTESVDGIQVPILIQMGDWRTSEAPDGSKLHPGIARAVVATWPLGHLSQFPGGMHFLHFEPTRANWTAEVSTYMEHYLDRPTTLS
eukprot:TRINITY_DN7243_c0_g3_i2.p1 TRINITY_DN7243_c0_g3~~TRINITY_DN7243_c0_g3_i2.p1  ORF type:complete len:308 (-),score=31.45 TRINITY_DN7243_c0_g3_i2:430-1353(-)